MLIAVIGQYFFGITIFICSMFLVMLVLVQRGRGGGLAGALGGPGGQSAFGTKAGDLFTRITIVVASIWIFLCVIAVMSLKERGLKTGVDRASTDVESMDSGRESTSPSLGGSDLGTTPATSGSTPSTGTGSGQPSTLDATTPAPAEGSTSTTQAATPTAEVTELDGGSNSPSQTPTAENPTAENPAAEVTPPAVDANVPPNELRPADSGAADSGGTEQP